MPHFPAEALEISEALWRQRVPHQLRRQRLTKLISEFSMLRELRGVKSSPPKFEKRAHRNSAIQVALEDLPPKCAG